MLGKPIQSVLVLGSGTAGLLAAITLKRKSPKLKVSVGGDPGIGVIGVGEGTTPNFPRLLFDYLGLSRGMFYKLAEPTWKLGIKFKWGPRDHFDYTFGQQLDTHWAGMQRPIGFYCDDKFQDMELASALMSADKAFPRSGPQNLPDIQPWHAFHIENKKFVGVLEQVTKASGIDIIDARIDHVTTGEHGVEELRADDGRTFTADLFIDSSGFRRELICKALGTKFQSYKSQLFCDRAVVGGWERGPDEPILPYTTAETMDAGWAWQIEHEHLVNRGYVYSSDHISDDEAYEEFKKKNPKIPDSPRVIPFESGAVETHWVKNVVAVGNSAGFVEPLEATAIMVICMEVQSLADMLANNGNIPTPTLKSVYNDALKRVWDDIREFLALHYLLNTRLDTPFWKRCQNETELGGLEDLLAFYKENGPTGFLRNRIRAVQTDFGLEGYLVMLVGNNVPYENKHHATSQEMQIFNERRSQYRQVAANGATVEETLQLIRHPGWQWNSDRVAQQQQAPQPVMA